MNMPPTGSESHIDYLDQKLAEHDRDFLLTRSFVARQDRLFLSALHALRAELRAIVGSVRDPVVALNKINWWQSEWQRLAEQRARHPVTQVLQQLLTEPPPPMADATLVLAQVCSDTSAWESVADLIEFARRLAVPFAALEAASVGAEQPSSGLQRCWQDIELLAIVSDLGRWSRAGRRSLPLDLMRRHKVGQQFTGQTMESLETAFLDLIEQSLKMVGQDYPGCGPNHAHIYREVQVARLNWLGRNPGARGELSAVRRLWAAWRGARFARAGERNET